MRKFVGAAVLLVFGASLALADDFQAIIVKEGDKYTIYKVTGKGKEAKKEDEATKLKISKDTKWVSRGFKSKEETDLSKEQVTEAFTKGKKEGQVRAVVTTDDKDKVTKITIFRLGGKKPKDKDKDKE